MCGEDPYIKACIFGGIYYITIFDIMEELVPKKKTF